MIKIKIYTRKRWPLKQEELLYCPIVVNCRTRQAKKEICKGQIFLHNNFLFY